MNDRYTPREIELNLIEVMWGLLAQWKAILIVALAFAVLVPSVVYVKDSQTYQAELKAKSENATKLAHIDQAIDKALSGLEEADRPAVEQAVINDDIIAAKQEYLLNSLLVNLNTDEAGSISIGYVFSGVDDVSMQNALLNGYISSVGGDKALKRIMSALNVDSQLRYVKELITVGGSADKDMAGVVTVSITCPNASTEGAVIDAINKIMMRANKGLSKSVTVHQIRRIYVNRASASTDTVAAAKSTAYNDLYNLQNVQRGHIGTFTEEQSATYTDIKALKAEAAAKAVEMGSSMNEMSKGEKELIVPRFSKKYAMVGFIIGIMIYACLYVFWLIIGKRIDNAGIAEAYTGTRLLGKFFYQEKRKHGLSSLLHSKAVAKHRYGKEMDLETQAERIAEEINASCKNKNIDEIALLKLFESEVGDTLLATVTDKLMTSYEIICAVPMVDLNALANKEQAVFFVDSDTKTLTLDRNLCLCMDYNIETVGTVFVGKL